MKRAYLNGIQWFEESGEKYVERVMVIFSIHNKEFELTLTNGDLAELKEAFEKAWPSDTK